MDWLLDQAPGFARLTNEERSAITDFALLWSLFEARILDNAASAAKIYAAAEAWRKADQLDADLFEPELANFRKRYFAGGEFTHHFNGLFLRPNDREPLVRAVLDGSDGEPVHRVACVFIIIMRYRNNLFHGMKWQYQLAGQHENFVTATRALIKALDRHGDLGHG